MKLYRIASRHFPIFDGTGAKLHGGRWNSPGRSIIYTSGSLSCARLEVLVHSGRDLPPGNHASIEIEVPDVVTSVSLGLSQLPPGWDEVPDIDRAKVIGDQWFDRMEGLLLCVPSVASAGDFNYLINQQHPEFGRLRPSDPAPVDWDSRLLK